MGWCGGTEIFDVVCETVLDNKRIPVEEQKKIITNLYDIMGEHDWDCQHDSAYFDHPIVIEIMKADDSFDEGYWDDDEIAYRDQLKKVNHK